MFIRHIGGIYPLLCVVCLTCKYSIFFWIGEKKYLFVHSSECKLLRRTAKCFHRAVFAFFV